MTIVRRRGLIMAAVFAAVLIFPCTGAYSAEVKDSLSGAGTAKPEMTAPVGNEVPKDDAVSAIKETLPPVPYEDEGLAVLFPTYLGMMTGGLVGLPLGMVVVLPTGVMGYCIFPIILYEEGKDTDKDNPVPRGTELAVMGSKPVIYLSYGLGYIVGFPFLAVKKIVYDLPKSLFYDPFHHEEPAGQAAKQADHA